MRSDSVLDYNRFFKNEDISRRVMLVAAVVMGHVVMIYIKDGPDKFKNKSVYLCVSCIYCVWGLWTDTVTSCESPPITG